MIADRKDEGTESKLGLFVEGWKVRDGAGGIGCGAIARHQDLGGFELGEKQHGGGSPKGGGSGKLRFFNLAGPKITVSSPDWDLRSGEKRESIGFSQSAQPGKETIIKHRFSMEHYYRQERGADMVRGPFRS